MTGNFMSFFFFNWTFKCTKGLEQYEHVVAGKLHSK